MSGQLAETIPDKITSKIRIEECAVFDLPGDCWNWYGRTNTRGYGTAYLEGCPRLLHRYFWEKFYGTIPDRMELDHLCQTERCVNPAHLEPVTGEENMRRRANPPYRLKKPTDYDSWQRFCETVTQACGGAES